MRDTGAIDYASAAAAVPRRTLPPGAAGHLGNLVLLTLAVATSLYYSIEEPFCFGPPRAKEVVLLWVVPALVSLLTLAGVIRSVIHVMRSPRPTLLLCGAAVLSLALPHVLLQYVATRAPLEYVEDVQIYHRSYAYPSSGGD